MIRVSKKIVPLNSGIKVLYINLHDFKDEEEQETIYQKVTQLIKEWESKRTVFG